MKTHFTFLAIALFIISCGAKQNAAPPVNPLLAKLTNTIWDSINNDCTLAIEFLASTFHAQYRCDKNNVHYVMGANGEYTLNGNDFTVTITTTTCPRYPWPKLGSLKLDGDLLIVGVDATTSLALAKSFYRPLKPSDVVKVGCFDEQGQFSDHPWVNY